MDIDTVVCLDAIDGLEFRTILCIQLIISATINNGSFQQWSLKSAASNRNNSTTTMLGVVDAKGLTQSYFQLQGKLKLWSFWSLLCADLNS